MSTPSVSRVSLLRAPRYDAHLRGRCNRLTYHSHPARSVRPRMMPLSSYSSTRGGWVDGADVDTPVGQVIRGAVPQTAAMEVLQIGYLYAVAAAGGCTLAPPSPDRGTDWVLTHESNSHAVDTEPVIKVQLKSTSRITPDPQGEHFSFPLKTDHFLKLAQAPVTITRLLIVMLVPGDIANWIESAPHHLFVRHRAYWANLVGQQPTGDTQTTVQIPTRNVFDDVALCNIMRQVGSGVTPQ
jgi:hypothetical protein